MPTRGIYSDVTLPYLTYVLGALSLDGIVENGEGCCVVCVKLDTANAVAVTASPHLQVLLQLPEPQRFCNEGCCC